MRDITFELCAETLAACLAARDGGAHRIELCANLDVGGLTPAVSLVREAIGRPTLSPLLRSRSSSRNMHTSNVQKLAARRSRCQKACLP